MYLKGLMFVRITYVLGFILTVFSLFTGADGFEVFRFEFYVLAVPITILALISILTDSHFRFRFLENMFGLYRSTIKMALLGFIFFILSLSVGSFVSGLFLMVILAWTGVPSKTGTYARLAVTGILLVLYLEGEHSAERVTLTCSLFLPGVLCTLFSVQFLFEKRARVGNLMLESVEALMTVAVCTVLPGIAAWVSVSAASVYLSQTRADFAEQAVGDLKERVFSFGFFTDIFLLILLVIALIYIYNKIRNRGTQKQVDEEGVEELFGNVRSLHLEKKRREVHTFPANMQIIRLYYSFVDFLTQQGFRKREAQTPMEFAREMSKKGLFPFTGIKLFSMLFLQARYSNRHMRGEDVDRAERSFSELREKLLAGR